MGFRLSSNGLVISENGRKVERTGSAAARSPQQEATWSLPVLAGKSWEESWPDGTNSRPTDTMQGGFRQRAGSRVPLLTARPPL